MHTARPGIVIGRRGAEADRLRRQLARITHNANVQLNIQEIKQPELDAALIAQGIVDQLAATDQLPPRHEACDPDGPEGGRPGRARAVLRPPRRLGDGAQGVLPRRPRPAAHAARRHRLRLSRGAGPRPAGSGSRSGSTRATSCRTRPRRRRRSPARRPWRSGDLRPGTSEAHRHRRRRPPPARARRAGLGRARRRARGRGRAGGRGGRAPSSTEAPDATAPAVADDPLEKLLAEEEDIERRTREQHHDVPHFRREND